MRWCLIVFLLVFPAGVLAEYKTIDDLAQAYGDEACKACHAAIHQEFRSSIHSRSLISALGITRDYLVTGLAEWKKPVDRVQVMRCMRCHAPQLAEASDALIQEVARLIVAAVDEKDEAAKSKATQSLGKLSVTCVICHHTMAAVEKNLKGEPGKGVFDGPHARPSPAHGTRQSNAFRSSLLCGQCHKIVTHTDGEIVFCTSLYESHQDAYRSGGKSQSCQDCHMRAGLGHRMPGSHTPGMIRQGIRLEADVLAVRLQPGKWVPAVVVNTGLTTRAGHRTPDG